MTDSAIQVTYYGPTPQPARAASGPGTAAAVGQMSPSLTGPGGVCTEYLSEYEVIIIIIIIIIQ